MIVTAPLLLTVHMLGHGLMLDPISRNAPQGINTLGGSMWFSQGCTIGCQKCNDTGWTVPACFPNCNEGEDLVAGTLGMPHPHSPSDVDGPTGGPPNVGGYGGDLCPNDHTKSKTPTNNRPEDTTMNHQAVHDGVNWTEWHPWRAPGSTPGFDPCGIAGGASTNMSYRAGGFGPQTGYPQGYAGSKLPAVKKADRKVWKAGETATVAWTSVANHGGGYSWALCPADSPLTEDCFEQTPLQFVDETTTLRYMFMIGNGTYGKNHTEVEIKANRVTEGVFPKGSMWSKNPVPPGTWNMNGGSIGSQGNDYPPQFSPPDGCDNSCWGYQPCNVGFTHPSYEGWNKTHKEPACQKNPDPGQDGIGCCHTMAYLAVEDKVHVPKVPAGEYVVRWRWDCEQSPQIWSGCGDVIIE